MKSVRKVTMLFVAIGLLALAGATWLALDTARFVAHAASVPGTVIELRPKRDNDGDTLWAPVVRFTQPDGREHVFESRTSSSPPSYSVGDRVEVLYFGIERPRIRSFGSLWGGALIVGFIGAIFTGIAGGILLHMRASEKKKNYLMAYGTAVETDFQSVERNESLEVNGRHPWRIVSQGQNPASGNLRLFKSENLWFDPTAYVKPGKITVLLDPKDERRYHMDVSFLPKLEGA